MRDRISVTILIAVILYVNSIFAESKEYGKTASQEVIAELRLKYYAAVEDEDKLIDFQNYLFHHFSKNKNKYSPTVLAYFAGIDAVKSKHAFWPHTKMKYLNLAMENLELAINLDPNNLEIRFMRFSILHYVPGFLGYSGERDADLEIISKLLQQKKIDSLDIKIVTGIVEFMIESGRISKMDEEAFRNIYPVSKNNE